MIHESTTHSRRAFLARCSAGLALPLCSPLARAATLLEGGAGTRRLVLLRLGGGNDGLNTVIPFEDDLYHKARPTLHVPKEQVLRLDDHVGLHPGLAELHRLFHDGALSVIQSVGYPQPDRSHFLSMDIWHSASPDRDALHSGWLGRAADTLPTTAAPPAYAVVRDEAPLALVGARGAAPTIGSIDELRLEDDAVADLIGATRSAPSAPLDHLLRAARTAVVTERRLRAQSREPLDDFPRSSLGRDLADVARLIDSDLGARLFYVAHDGFDTHTRQKDNHAALLRDLSRSVSAFFSALRRLGKDEEVLLLTFSEFGRRVRENGSLGTDHGAAAPMLAVSPAVRGGILGAPPDLADLDDGDVRYRVDFRQVYATVLDRWLGLDADRVLGRSFERLPWIDGRPR